MAERKASEKQLKFIWRLKKELDITTQWHANMNFKTAQRTIEELLAIKEREEAKALQLRDAA